VRVAVAEEVFKSDIPLPIVAQMQTRAARADRAGVDLRRLVARFLRMKRGSSGSLVSERHSQLGRSPFAVLQNSRGNDEVLPAHPDALEHQRSIGGHLDRTGHDVAHRQQVRRLECAIGDGQDHVPGLA
jgi:hypothetical protein